MSTLAWIEDQKRLKLLNAPKYVNPASDSSKGLWTRCDKCGVILYIKHLKENQRVCFGCSYHLQMSSQERVENLLDKESWRPLDETVSPCDPLEFHDQKDYTDRLQEAQERTGLQDAIQTGSGMIDGIPIALGVMDFEFMGGSMGSVVGEKVTRLIEYATQEGLTLVLVCASGGARMQEGVFSLMQMAKISSALQVYQACANLLYISILTSPTTGGVTASFAMLGDIIFAEPKALVAFAGRRVIEQTLCEDLPEDFQTSEYMLHHGLLDLIVPRRFFRQALSESIRLYKNAPFKKPGRIPFGVQNPITFLIEERIRRRWAVGNASVADRLSRLSEESAPQFAENTLFSASAQDASTRDASAQDASAQDESLQNKDAVISAPKLLNNRVANTFDNIRRSPKSITEGQVQVFSSSPYPLLKREASDYRDILTSFQTMFHLFSKELVVPYATSTADTTFDENNTRLDPTQKHAPKEKQTVVNTFARRIKRTNFEQKQDAYGTNPENWNVDSPELTSVVHASLDTASDLDKPATSMHLLLQKFITLSENQNINQVETEVEEDVSPDNASNGINISKLAKNETGKISQTQSLAQARQINLNSDETNFPDKSSDSVSTPDYSALSSQNRPEETAANLSNSPSIYVDFFNQSIELAATESVEWRAFYLHQSISQRTGFLEDLAQSLPDYQKNSHDIAFQNMLFYRSICRKLS